MKNQRNVEENGSSRKVDVEGVIEFLTVEEAAQLLNLKVSRLRYEVFRKSIPFFKVGRSIRFAERDLISWIMSQKQEPAGQTNG